jgi:FtsZ-binding cell division protein ZapB
VYCELLGAEDGEISWHRYNDSRQNGTTGLKALQAHFPNLRLLSHESRRLRRLDSVLGDWEKSLHSAADSLPKGLGALVVFGVEALPVLQGGDSWLERFSQLLVPPPLLEANGDLEAWPDLLRRHYIKPSSDNQQNALVLLEQDRERLLEERLQQAINRINTLEAEHDAIKTERDGLVTKQQELSTQRDTLSKERDALKTERDGLVTKQQELSTQRDTLSKERDSIQQKIEVLKETIGTSNQQLASFKSIFSGLIIAHQESRHES